MKKILSFLVVLYCVVLLSPSSVLAQKPDQGNQRPICSERELVATNNCVCDGDRQIVSGRCVTNKNSESNGGDSNSSSQQLDPQEGGLRNPSIPEKLGRNVAQAKEGTTFTYYFVFIWRALISVGAILVLINFIWGAFDWLSANGETSKITSARNKIAGAVMGLIILVGSFVIIGFIDSLFQLNILKLTLPTPG